MLILTFHNRVSQINKKLRTLSYPALSHTDTVPGWFNILSCMNGKYLLVFFELGAIVSLVLTYAYESLLMQMSCSCRFCKKLSSPPNINITRGISITCVSTSMENCTPS
jgi:hypothetical protein